MLTTLPGMVTDVRPAQSRNAESPMLSTLSGSDRDERLPQP